MTHDILKRDRSSRPTLVRLPNGLLGAALLVALSCATAKAHDLENSSIIEHAQQQSGPFTGSFSSSWESHYYLEGRDVLDGDSILSQTLELQWESLAFGVWYGNSTQQRYDELHTSVLLLHDFGSGLECYLGYNHVRFPHGVGHHDHEIHTGLSYVGAPMDIEYALDAYHSFEANGFFVQASAGRSWEITEALSVDLTAIIGMNQGYVADGHDGANHAALSLGLSYALSESLTLGAHGTYNWGIERKAAAPDDAQLRDFFHAGIGLEWSF